MAGTSRREDTLHNPSVSLGERLQRKLQWVASRRTAQRRDFLHPSRSKGDERSLASALQHDPTPQQLGLSTTSPRLRFAAIAAFRFRPEERREGKECVSSGRSGGARYEKKQKHQ